MNTNNSSEMEFSQSSLSLEAILVTLLAVAVGAFAAVAILPAWMPNMANSLQGDDIKAYWYLSRGTAFVSLSLLWVSMALGLGITNKMARLWPGAPTAFAIHEYVSLLGLAFALFHGLILMGDQYINFSLVQVLMPFASANFKPFWVGLGQLAVYAWTIVTFSFYIRPQIGPKVWRGLHYASFLTYLGALIHGLTSGTDTSLAWAQIYYWFSGGSLLFLLVYRILASLPLESKAPQTTA